MADELLSCPFCGGEARISRAHQNKMLAMGEVPTDEHYLFTLYHDCANGITICWTYKPKDALIAAWNRRTPPTPATDANPFVGTNWQVRSDTPAAEEREAVARALFIAGEEDDFNYKGYLELADAALSALAPIRAQEIAAARAEEQGYRHTQVAALKQVHAAEILAAEANERARALGQAAEHINRLDAALRGLLSTVERLDISEGVCCCGDDMATHAEPMSCGHTPVDAGHYHHGNAIQQARDAIEHGAGK